MKMRDARHVRGEEKRREEKEDGGGGDEEKEEALARLQDMHPPPFNPHTATRVRRVVAPLIPICTAKGGCPLPNKTNKHCIAAFRPGPEAASITAHYVCLPNLLELRPFPSTTSRCQLSDLVSFSRHPPSSQSLFSRDLVRLGWPPVDRFSLSYL